MNANTALKINDAVHQAIRNGETPGEIRLQVDRAILHAQRDQLDAKIADLQKQRDALA